MTAPRLAPGAVVAGKYRIHALLGYGGSSATYQAASAEAQVALKMLSPALAQRQDMVAAVRQFNAGTNSLPPDVVVPVVDFGYDPATAAPYSATGLVREPTLAQLIAQRPLSAEETANLITGIARGIDAAHIRQMAHHALKPNNVFVGSVPSMSVRVMDFGASLARSVTPTQEGYEQSAPWMAPEQVKASAPAGAPADIFSAALLAFYALTGRSYWRSCQQQRPDIPQWQREVVSPQVPASQRAREVGFTLDPSLDPAFARALTLNPGERYRTVGEFAAALSAIATPRSHATATSEATMAFPASAFEPPPGAVMPAAGRPAEGGYSSGGRSDGPYPPPPPPMGGQGVPPQQPSGSMQGGLEGPSVQAFGAPTPEQTRRQPTGGSSAPRGKAATIVVIAVAAVILLGGGAAAFVMSRSHHDGDDKADAAAIATEAAKTAPAPTAEPTAAATAEPAPAAPAAPEVDAGPADVSVKITCEPACGDINVDEKPLADPTAALELPPGKHKIVITKEGFVSKTDTILVVAGKPFEKEYKLVEKPTGPATASTGPSGPAPTKPCGKFLKACPK